MVAPGVAPTRSGAAGFVVRTDRAPGGRPTTRAMSPRGFRIAATGAVARAVETVSPIWPGPAIPREETPPLEARKYARPPPTAAERRCQAAGTSAENASAERRSVCPSAGLRAVLAAAVPCPLPPPPPHPEGSAASARSAVAVVVRLTVASVGLVAGREDLETAVATVVGRCLGIRAGEEVVVVADPASRAIGEAFREAAHGLGAEAVLVFMEERANDGAEPPASVAAALGAADVLIAPTTRSLSHTAARRNASANGARGATLPGVTEDMLARLMSVDFDVLRERSRAVAALLEAADVATLTCPHGTDFTLDLTGRHGISDDGDLTGAGAFGNLPCGEGFIAPVGGHGRLMAVSLANMGPLPEQPVEITVEDGMLTHAAGPVGERFMAVLDGAGAEARTVAELGVGTNENATLTGNILEDEKILGTAHVAFGASRSMGGTVQVPVHLDVLIERPTLTIGDTRVLDAGAFLL
jgi:leucyl aminopeptidase (aminopeptidase T)